MAAREWYRRTSWSDSEREDFEKRLARARPHSRAQYLRIQAAHLADTRDERLTRVALDLLSRMLAEYPDRVQTAQGHAQRAECLLQLGDWNGAVEAFRAVLDAERAFPSVKTNAYLRFGYLVTTRGARELFDEVERIAEEHAGESRPFPVLQFEWHAVQAFLGDARADAARAREHARAALAAADADVSGFRHHSSVGLVHEVDPAVETRLRVLAGYAGH
jgi:hypothetical protein